MMKIRDLRKEYFKDKDIIVALDNISFNFPDIGFIGLTGRSGSGKTTLLHIIGKLEKQTSGDITTDILYKDEDVSFVFQDFNLIEEMSVIDNIYVGFNNYQIEINDERIDDTLRRLKIYHYKFQKVKQLSQGEKQRVSIARALYKKSKILIADEPTGSVDHKNAIEIFEILKEISKECLVIVSSHNKTLIKNYADVILELEKGKIKYSEIVHHAKYIKSPVKEIESKKSSKLFLKLAFLHTGKKFLLQNIFYVLLTFTFLTSLIFLLSFVMFNEKDKAIDQMYLDIKPQVMISYLDENGKIQRISKSEILDNEDIQNIGLVFPVEMQVFNLPINVMHDIFNKVHLVGVSEEIVSHYNFKIQAGTIPKEPGEIMITSIQFELFKRYGVVLNGEYQQIYSEMDILNKEIESFSKHIIPKTVITGIIDTGYDINEYLMMMDDIDHYKDELNYLSKKTAHFLVYTNILNVEYFSESFGLPIAYRESEYGIIQSQFSVSIDLNNELSEGEIALNHQNAYIFGYTNKTLTMYKEDHIDEVIHQYALAYFPEIKDQFTSDVAQGKWWLAGIEFNDELDYTDYIKYINQRVRNGGSNVYDFNMGDIDINKIADASFLKFIPITSDVPLVIGKGTSARTYKVKYLVTSNEFSFIHYNDFIYQKNLSDAKIYDSLLVFPSKKGNLNNLLNKDKTIEASNEYVYQTQLFNMKLTNFSFYFPNLFKVLVVIIVLLLTLLIYNLTFTKLKVRQKEIGLLKTLGYTYRKIYINYLIEPITIALTAFVLSLVIGKILISNVNISMHKQYNLFNQMLTISQNDLIVIIIIGMASILIAIVLSIFIRKKRSLSSIIREF